jgi:Leucine-rich repeat (LRR) protein
MSDATLSPTPLVRSRCRWLRFSLRTMMLLVTLLCVWLGVTSYRANKQKRAVERLAGQGSVGYDYQTTAPFGAPRPLPPGPAWLRELIGSDYFVTVDSADVYVKSAGDDSIAALEDFPQLCSLDLHGPGVTDSVLARLSKLTQLRNLCLYDNSITESGWESVGQFIHLKRLLLGGSNVTDVSLERIAGLGELVELRMVDCPVTDVGLQYIKRLRHLQLLDIRGTGITDTGLADLQRAFPKMKQTYPKILVAK